MNVITKPNMNDERYITTTAVRKQFGISTSSLRNWERDGKIRCLRPNGTRRIYHLGDIKKFFGNSSKEIEKETVCYARVSSSHQKEDLERQIKVLEKEYPGCRVIKDVASGINFKRPGFISLLELVDQGHVNEVVVTYKDRLCRFGYEIIEWLFKQRNTRLVVLSQDTSKEDPSRELSEDLLSIVNVFVARNNGLRAGQQRRWRKEESKKDQDQDENPKEGPSGQG